ncbi:MAG: hypothetical protein ACE5KT_11470 [Methanosarcinales archaeon]
MSKSHEWIEKERKTLRKKYPEKVILVCESKVVKVFDTPANIQEVFKEADKICGEKDWSWAYISATEERMILWH